MCDRQSAYVILPGSAVAAVVLALLLGIVASISVAADGTNLLEAEVQARAERVAALRREYDQTVDELEKTPELAPIAQAKSRYALLQYQLLLDAQGRQHDAERLRDSQRELMEQTRKAIEPAIHAIPAVAKLAELGRQIAAVDDNYKETRHRVVAVVAAARNAQDVGDRLADLKRRQSDLEAQLVRLKAKVAAQTNAAVKAHNQGLLAKADQLLADGRSQIAELEASSAAASVRLAAVTSETDLAAARATAERIRLAWNRASRQRDEAADLWGLCDLSTSITMSGSGNVSKHTLDGQDIPLDLKEPVELLPGESIRTGRDSQVKLRLLDGSFIQLGETSSFTLRGVNGDDFLESGAMHRFNRLLNHLMQDPPRRTPNAALAERGTDYLLQADESQTTCAVLSGQVAFTPIDPAAKPLVVRALQHATLTHDAWTVETITPGDYERLLDSFDPDVK